MSSDYSMAESLNVLGEELLPCSNDPLTGFFRDGHCNTCQADYGSHTVCAVMTEEFLAFSKYVGNDLSTPKPEFHLKVLKLAISGVFAPVVSYKHMTKAALQKLILTLHTRKL